MTVQSSFLIRCTLNRPADSASGKAYYIQHVQTSAELRAATLEEVTAWISDQNQHYLTTVLDSSPFETSEEDAQ